MKHSPSFGDLTVSFTSVHLSIDTDGCNEVLYNKNHHTVFMEICKASLGLGRRPEYYSGSLGWLCFIYDYWD